MAHTFELSPEFRDLVGHFVGFCGVDNYRFCLFVGNKRHVFEVVEDEDDGYRSAMDKIEYIGPVKPKQGKHGVFFRHPIVTLRVQVEEQLEGFCLFDERGHVWLKFGTDYSDEYYPMFCFDYDPPHGS